MDLSTLKEFPSLVLRSLSLLFSASGNAGAALALNKLADMVDAGKEVDAYMKEVATALVGGTARSWDEINADIAAEVDSFLGRTSLAPPPVPLEDDPPDDEPDPAAD